MLSEYETYLLDKIDSRCEHAMDDELFAGGYFAKLTSLFSDDYELEQENNTQLSALKILQKRVFKSYQSRRAFSSRSKYWFYRRGMILVNSIN